MIRNSDLVADLMQRHGMAESDAANFVDTAFALIQDGLQLGEIVKVKGLGTFKVMQTKERESVDVNTGERILLSSKPKVIFTPDIVLRERVNAPFAGFASVPLSEGVEVDVEQNDDNATTNINEIAPKEISEAEPTSQEETSDKPEEATEEDEKASEEVAIEEPKSDELPIDEPITTEDEPMQREDEPDLDMIHTYLAEKKIRRLRKSVVLLSILLFLSIGLSAYLLWRAERIMRTPQPIAMADNTETEKVKPASDTQKSTPDTITVAQADSAKNTKATTIEPKKEEKKAEKAVQQTQPKANYPSMERPFRSDDPRIKHGAYYIIGTKTTVTIEKGQTLEGICRAYLGEGMECYVEVFNGKTSAKAGDKIKIPQLITKKAWKKKMNR